MGKRKRVRKEAAFRKKLREANMLDYADPRTLHMPSEFCGVSQEMAKVICEKIICEPVHMIKRHGYQFNTIEGFGVGNVFGNNFPGTLTIGIDCIWHLYHKFGSKRGAAIHLQNIYREFQEQNADSVVQSDKEECQNVVDINKHGE